MTWKHVLYSEHKRWGKIGTFFDFVLQSGYKFFTWGGRVYMVRDAQHYTDTGLTVKDLA